MRLKKNCRGKPTPSMAIRGSAANVNRKADFGTMNRGLYGSKVLEPLDDSLAGLTGGKIFKDCFVQTATLFQFS